MRRGAVGAFCHVLHRSVGPGFKMRELWEVTHLSSLYKSPLYTNHPSASLRKTAKHCQEASKENQLYLVTLEDL